MTHEDTIRELIYKSWHRGCKETDILLGFFAKSCVQNMSDETIALYKDFISEPDWDIYAWLTDGANPPEKYTNIINMIVEYHQNKRHQC
jgi:antitoxin CptB